VSAAHGTVAAKRATELTIDELVAVRGELTEGQWQDGREASEPPSSGLRASVRSKTDGYSPLELRTYGTLANPVAFIGAFSKYNRARDHILSVVGFGAYSRQVPALPKGPKSQRSSARSCSAAAPD
jgi:hypothetical protein